MIPTRTALAAFALAFAIYAPSAVAQTSADSSAIKATSLDYIEGWYEGNAQRVDAGAWVDYLHIAKWNGRWVIVNVLWEERPK